MLSHFIVAIFSLIGLFAFGFFMMACFIVPIILICMRWPTDDFWPFWLIHQLIKWPVVVIAVILFVVPGVKNIYERFVD